MSEPMMIVFAVIGMVFSIWLFGFSIIKIYNWVEKVNENDKCVDKLFRENGIIRVDILELKDRLYKLENKNVPF